MKKLISLTNTVVKNSGKKLIYPNCGGLSVYNLLILMLVGLLLNACQFECYVALLLPLGNCSPVEKVKRKNF